MQFQGSISKDIIAENLIHAFNMAKPVGHMGPGDLRASQLISNDDSTAMHIEQGPNQLGASKRL
jgi:hypothetical protein